MKTSTLIVAGVVLAGGTTVLAQNRATTSAASSSLMTQAVQNSWSGNPHVAGVESPVLGLFQVSEREPREFQKHDLIQIVIRESSSITSEHETDADKAYVLGGRVKSFHPWLGTADLPDIEMEALKGFGGDAEYERDDDFTARITVEVIEVLPNGNLILEGKTFIKTDEEEQDIRLTGVCRPSDVTAANTVLSSQVHNLKVEKMHKGELRKANQKGVLAKLADFLFAW